MIKKIKAKKGPKAKLYAGYLVFEFIYDGKLIYKIQTDYMKNDTSDVPERMDCVIKSFISLKKRKIKMKQKKYLKTNIIFLK